MERVETVDDLIRHLQNNCNGSDRVCLKLWNTEVKKQVYLKTEGNDGYPYNGYVILTAHE
jgi:hypothetical protein